MDIMNNLLEIRKALQYYLATMDSDADIEKMLAVPSVFPAYAVGTSYRSTIDGNVWAPDAYPAGWEQVSA